MKRRRNLTYAAALRRRRQRLRLLLYVMVVVIVVVVVSAIYYATLLQHPSPRDTATQERVGPSFSTQIDSAVDSHDFPDSHLTPGVIIESDSRVVCRPGYAASIRPRGDSWRTLKDAAYGRYGIPRGHRSTVDQSGVHRFAFEIDHLIPLELGGSPNDIRNLWPQPIASAKEKDQVENGLHEMVCGGRTSLEQAQRAIVVNWQTAISTVEGR